MRRVIYYMSFLIFSLISLGQDFRGEISKFYSNDVLAVGTTNRVRFSAEVTLTKDFANNQEPFLVRFYPEVAHHIPALHGQDACLIR